MGKEAKTNAMRILEREKVPYTAHEYAHEEGVAVAGVDVAGSMGEDPACVSACRFDALVFGDVNDPNAFVTKLLDFKDSVRVRPQLGTKPSLRYIPLKKES